MKDNTPKIYVADLEAYNSGKLKGEWLDLTNYSDADELMEAINKTLGESEEYAIHDTENIPKQLVDEYMGYDEFQKIYSAMEKAERSHLPIDILIKIEADGIDEDNFMLSTNTDDDGDIAREYIEMIGGIEYVSNAEYYFDFDAFGEEYRSEMDEDEIEWAEDMSDSELGHHLVDNMGGIEGLSKNTIENFFDYDSFGSDLSHDYSIYENEYGQFYVFHYAKGGKVGMETNLRFYGDNLKYIEHSNKTFKPIYFYEKLADAKKYMQEENKSSNKDYEHIILPYENEKGKCYVIYREVQNGETSMANGGKFMKGGTLENVYTLQNPKQFKEVIEIYNDLSKKTDLIKGYYLDHNSNSMVILTTPNISDVGKDEIYEYVESLRSKGFSIINFKKTIDTDKYDNGLSWGTEKGGMIKKSGSDDKDHPQSFKLYLIDRIKYEKGGEMGMENDGKTTNKNYEIVSLSKEAEKDGGKIYKFRFLVNAGSLEEAKKIARNLWYKEFHDYDFYLLDLMSDEEYRSEFLRKTGGKTENKNMKQKVTTNSGVIQSFLSTNDEVKTKNLSSHYNEQDKFSLLRNYNTLIAIRSGKEVKLTKHKYSVTTSKIQNEVRREAEAMGLKVIETNEFAKGGGIKEGEIVRVEGDMQGEILAFLDNKKNAFVMTEDGIIKKVPVKDLKEVEENVYEYIDYSDKMKKGGSVKYAEGGQTRKKPMWRFW